MAKNDVVDVVDINIDANNGLVVANNYGSIQYYNNVAKMPSLIADIVKALADIDEDDTSSSTNTSIVAFRPEDKIEYNCVIKYKAIIEEHATYYSQCQETINIFDDSNIGAKSKILRCVKNWYLEAKGDLLKNSQGENFKEIDIIRANSDNLIERVKNKIYSVSKENARDSVSVEEIELGVTCFTCFCFMECKILEKPL